jgi:1-acyl-sn-glycerol-3-phosphate acyltransferase
MDPDPRPGRPIRILNLSTGYQLMGGCVFWLIGALVIFYCNLVFRLRVVGRRNLRRLPPSGCFVISNHTLYLDPGIIGYALQPRRALFSAMEETFHVPYLGAFIRFLGAFPIPQDLSLRRLVGPLRRAMQRGWLIHFFPERHLKFQNQRIQPFFPGVFYLAHLFDVPVLPVTLVLRHPTLFGRRLSRYLVHVTAVVGAPLYPRCFSRPGESRRQTVQRMAQHARERMQRTIARAASARKAGGQVATGRATRAGAAPLARVPRRAASGGRAPSRAAERARPDEPPSGIRAGSR